MLNFNVLSTNKTLAHGPQDRNLHGKLAAVKGRVNFRGVITPVFDLFYVFTPFLRGCGVMLRLKYEA